MPQLVLSLFPGIGLLDMAFEEEGFVVVRGPDVLWGGDIKRFHPPAGKFDGVIGGPPCQSFSSLAHLVRANGHEPKFGNLIPEFERCVLEAQPEWFLMENVRAAPCPFVLEKGNNCGYGVHVFLLNNAWLLGKDGLGQEQERLRQFSFGLRGKQAPNLKRWIDFAALMLPETSNPVTASHDSLENTTAWSKTRKKAFFGDGRPTRQEVRHPHKADDAFEEFHDAAEKAIDSMQSPEQVKQYKELEKLLDAASDGSAGAAQSGGRHKHECLTGGHDKPPSARKRQKTLTSSDGGPSVRMSRYSFADACRLQGLPENFLADAPFRADGKLKAVANGVPIPMGRAIARAVKEAIGAASTVGEAAP